MPLQGIMEGITSLGGRYKISHLVQYKVSQKEWYCTVDGRCKTSYKVSQKVWYRWWKVQVVVKYITESTMSLVGGAVCYIRYHRRYVWYQIWYRRHM